MPGLLSVTLGKTARALRGGVQHVARSARRLACLAAVLAPMAATGGCAGLTTGIDITAYDAPEVKLSQAMRMAETVRAGGDARAAAIFYRRAHALAPEQPAPLIGLADAAASAGATSEAAELYRQALTLDPQNTSARVGFGRVLVALDRPQQAIEELQAAIAAGATDYRAHLALGVAFEMTGDPSRAKQAYRDGLEQNPQNASLRNNLALSLALGGEHDEAIAMLQDLAGEFASGARVRQNLALAYALAGRMDEAAASAARDLRGAELGRGLAFYESLRYLEGEQLAAAVLCRCSPVVPVAALSRPQTPASPVPVIVGSNEPAAARVALLRTPQVEVVNSVTKSKTLVVLDRPHGARAKARASGRRTLAAAAKPVEAARPSVQRRFTTLAPRFGVDPIEALADRTMSS